MAPPPHHQQKETTETHNKTETETETETKTQNKTETETETETQNKTETETKSETETETETKTETESRGSLPEPEPVVPTVDVTAARELIATAGGGHRYLDVRTEEELSKLGHLVEVDRSINVPYMLITPQGDRVKNAEFVEQVASLFTSKEEPIVVGCQSGKRSELACIDLLAAGYKNVKNMGGGYLAWLDHGFPVHHTNNPATNHKASVLDA